VGCPWGAGGAAVVFLCFVLLVPTGLSAQSITGRVIEESSNVPLSGSFVLLLDMRDNELSRVMTDGLGRFTLRVPRDGVYRVRAMAVGRQSYASDPIPVVGGATVEYVVEMTRLAVELPALVVQADRNCRVRPEAGLAAAALWAEARKALESVVWTERQGILRHKIARYDRQLDPRTLDVLDQEIVRSEGIYEGSPFVTQSPAELEQLGYVRELPSGEWTFDAPDAHVLLSDEFADVHCFAVREPRDNLPDLVGLAFEPVTHRDVADIDGVIWLNGETSELQFLEYRYRGLPAELSAVESRVIGGQVEFLRLQNGPWVVKQWRILMPEVGLRERRDRRIESILLGVREQGGWVEEVQALNGDLVWHLPAGVLTGRVAWRGEPVVGVDLVLAGTGRSTRSIGGGWFQFDSLTSGRYVLIADLDAMESSLDVRPPEIVTLGGATDTTIVELVLEDPLKVRARLCSESDPQGTTGMVAGLVLDGATGAALADITVKIAWQRGRVVDGVFRREEVSLAPTTDERGYYFGCGIPIETILTVETEPHTYERWSEQTEVGRERVRRVDLVLQRRQ
jgi:hypothetical protein